MLSPYAFFTTSQPAGEHFVVSVAYEVFVDVSIGAQPVYQKEGMLPKLSKMAVNAVEVQLGDASAGITIRITPLADHLSTADMKWIERSVKTKLRNKQAQWSDVI